MAIAKLREFSGLQKIAPANIEARSTETELRDAQFALDLQLHDLRTEFIGRESNISCAPSFWSARIK
jgi:hypothetical protein